MIGKLEATKIAENYVLSQPELESGYYLSIESGIKVDVGWYFDYRIICKLDIPESEQAKFAGAFGVLVNSSTSEVSDISYHQWVDLGLAFHDQPYGEDGA